MDVYTSGRDLLVNEMDDDSGQVLRPDGTVLTEVKAGRIVGPPRHHELGTPLVKTIAPTEPRPEIGV